MKHVKSKTIIETAAGAKDVLVRRDAGGAGDILMHRPLFRPLKLNYNGCWVTAAIPERYLPLLQDHPFIDELIAVEELDPELKFDRVFDTLDKAAAYEFSRMPFIDLHRTEIWARHMGFQLTEYEGCLSFSADEQAYADGYFDKSDARPRVGLAPISAHPSKDLPHDVMQEAITLIDRAGYSVFVFHDKPAGFTGITAVPDTGLRNWMVLHSRMDYIITMATATFNLANLLRKPSLAVFGVEDLKTFGKFFPEMLPLQRTRSDPNWPYCPCWSSMDCKLREPEARNEYPPECLKSIKAYEIYEAFTRLVERPVCAFC